jgi:hypothetical protein
VEFLSLARLLARKRRVEALETLPPHLFGVEAELELAPSPPEADGEPGWWQTEYGNWRLAAEAKAMRRFPGFRTNVSRGRLGWRGWLQSALPQGRRYLVYVTYPHCFPDEPPVVSITHPAFPSEGVPHLLSGQRPCLYHGGYRDGYDPARTTAATLVAWTALWIHAFETWQATGTWPGAED